MIMKMKPTEYLSRDTETVADSLAAMIKRELNTFSCSYHYHGGYIDPSDPNMITADDRMQLVDWCYGIVDHYRYSREIVASAMEMVDRFLSMPSNCADAARVSDEALRDQSKFQLLTVTALYISIKINEEVVLSSDLFSELCRHIYSAEEIEDTERTLLRGLSWRCHAPTAHQVGMSLLSLLLPYVEEIPEVTWGFLMDEVKYLTELAVRDYYFSTEHASTIALAALLNVIHDTTDRLQELLAAFLRVIMGCFDFDHPTKIAAARKRLDSLAGKPGTGTLTEEGDDEDERSLLDISVKTYRASNRSSEKRKRNFEGNCRRV